ncbi:MAG: ABC transporter ATP-binding protein, partial [Oscillospiraceae bacterium]
MMNKSVLKRILSYTKPYIGYLILALISAIISVVATLFAPVVIGKAIDLIIGKSNVDFLIIFAFLLVLAMTVLISAIFQWLMNFCTNIITQKTVKDIRDNVFEKLQYVPLNYIDKTPHGDIISRVVNDIDQISDGLLQGFTQLFSGIVTIIGTIVFMLTINVPIALVVILVTPLSLFVASFIAKRSFSMFREQAAVKGELGGYIEEMIGNQKVIKAFGYEQRSQEKFSEINSRLYDYGVKAQF